MVVSCPKCGQEVRGQPGMIGPCPRCKTRFTFPDGDPMLGELVTCIHCGQKQRYKNGFCVNCGKRVNEAEPVVDPPKKKQSASASGGFTFAFIVMAILFLLAQCGKLVGKGDGSSCYICGKDAAYTTDSGYGLCGRHLIEGLDYDKR